MDTTHKDRTCAVYGCDNSHAKGFTIVELLVVMLIGAILSVSVVATFVNQTRAMALNEDLVDLEQNLRVAMDMLHRDVRMAGAYGEGTFPAFVIGGIDSDGNGTLDKNSDGGSSPDAIQLRYSETPGLSVITLAGTEFRVCSPSGMVPGQIMALRNDDGSLFQELEVKNVGTVACAGCTGTCDKINYDPPVLDGSYSNGVLFDKMNTVTYYIEPDYVQDGNSLGPVLMQKRGLAPLPPPYVVAFGVNDLQIVYRDIAGAATTTLADIKRVELSLTGETRNEHNIGGTPAKRTRVMTTEVLVRNLAL